MLHISLGETFCTSTTLDGVTEIYTISPITCIKVLVLSAGGCLVQIVQIDLQSQLEWKVQCCHLVAFLDDLDRDQYPHA